MWAVDSQLVSSKYSYYKAHRNKSSSNAGVGNLFSTADRFETEIFSRTGLQKPQMFSNEHLLQLM